MRRYARSWTRCCRSVTDSVQSFSDRRRVAYSPDGTRIVTASDDKTARIWDAHVPATLSAQILWDSAAETDPLPEVDRSELGLPPDPRVRQWVAPGSACDRAAAAFYDPDRLTRGLVQGAIVADVANSACSARNAPTAKTSRLAYQSGRALLAKSDLKGARQQFELAVSAGYRAAQVDLANLLIDPSAGMLDPERAAALYQKAWQDGVPIAAFALGHLYDGDASGHQISQRLGLGIERGRCRRTQRGCTFRPARGKVCP